MQPCAASVPLGIVIRKSPGVTRWGPLGVEGRRRAAWRGCGGLARVAARVGHGGISRRNRTDGTLGLRYRSLPDPVSRHASRRSTWCSARRPRTMRNGTSKSSSPPPLLTRRRTIWTAERRSSSRCRCPKGWSPLSAISSSGTTRTRSSSSASVANSGSISSRTARGDRRIRQLVRRLPRSPAARRGAAALTGPQDFWSRRKAAVAG